MFAPGIQTKMVTPVLPSFAQMTGFDGAGFVEDLFELRLANFTTETGPVVVEWSHSRALLALNDGPIRSMAVPVRNQGVKGQSPCPKIQKFLFRKVVFRYQHLFTYSQKQTQGVAGSFYWVKIGINRLAQLPAFNKGFVKRVLLRVDVDEFQKIPQSTSATGDASELNLPSQKVACDV